MMSNILSVRHIELQLVPHRGFVSGPGRRPWPRHYVEVFLEVSITHPSLQRRFTASVMETADCVERHHNPSRSRVRPRGNKKPTP